ncbi:inhibitor of apoptosis protein [Neodiprion lecontei nucleopolyhedrovirus]|uniref:Inhibitor of apoptosis protein n=1 Tax=Neodiprion lecontei nucleopolyhedrovirus (strain Canada) TaxID=654906 RepID=Q6JPG0_NPVNC|nr:inhibitor of apoptosis protein [Neodiprion lecontei nucleopolyhedrovirus]AAQ99055.1 inhibitor of apoptosis protein [Neodiprion lecontei nucleopolyhedrovirus]
MSRNIYRYEKKRLESFDSWPVKYIKSEDLAKSGFYYTGISDIVRCFDCRIEIKHWKEHDDPTYEHRRWSERCRMVREITCGNVPLELNNDVKTIETRSRCSDVCGIAESFANIKINAKCQLPSIDVCGITESFANIKMNYKYQLPNSSEIAIYPQYKNLQDRQSSFEEWPISLKSLKTQLAYTGFFYTQKGDVTICFHCGLVLKDWYIHDTPINEHAKWFDKCKYLTTLKNCDSLVNLFVICIHIWFFCLVYNFILFLEC